MAWTEQDDFIAFSFGNFDTSTYNTGSKSFIRTSDGDRYNQHLSPQLNDKTADVPGGDGMYFFGTTHKSKVFDVSFAFQGLTRSNINDIKKAFDGKEIKELCFAEESNRVYMAKVTSQPSIKMLAFGDGANETYNGEGTVQFTAYWPYARSKTLLSDGTNLGDLPAPFIVNHNGNFTADRTFKVGTLEITIKKEDVEGLTNFTWDSKSGMVSAEKNGTRIPIPYTGNSLGAIPIGGVSSTNISLNSGTLSYYYWYY